MWPKLYIPEVTAKSICSFAGGRLTFLKLDSTSVGLVGVSGFLKAKSLITLFSVIESIACSLEFNACHDKSIHSFFDLFCVIDDEVRICVGLWRGFNFQLEGLKSFKAFSSGRSSLAQTFVESCVDFEVAHLSVLMIRRLPYSEIPTLSDAVLLCSGGGRLTEPLEGTDSRCTETRR